MTQIVYLPGDVQRVATALIDTSIENDTSSVIGRSGYDFCTHCTTYEFEAGKKDRRGYPHALDCPVLIAQDLLTGPAEDKQEPNDD